MGQNSLFFDHDLRTAFGLASSIDLGVHYVLPFKPVAHIPEAGVKHALIDCVWAETWFGNSHENVKGLVFDLVLLSASLWSVHNLPAHVTVP